MKRLLWLPLLALVSCGGPQQSVIDSAGTQSGRIETLWWFFLWLLGAIFVVVAAVLLLALRRTHRGVEQEPLEQTHAPSAATENKLVRNVTVASATTIVVLLALIVVSVATGKAVSNLRATGNGMVVEVTGNQWWWNVRYANDQASRIVVTANEIHIPVGRPVMIRGSSNDVIHSFWVPNLQGKIDFIPSRVNTQWLEAGRPGRFRGQCAEFCGAQHAHMALWVIAEAPAEFDAWMRHQLEPAAEPEDPVKQRGREVFLDNACILCHTIAGTGAAGQVGPDLTHFGSRITLAAGTLPNTKGNLGGWIADPQNIKPGNHMAAVPLNSEDVEPLLEYLESLK